MVERHRNYKQRYVDCRLCRRYVRVKNLQKHLQKKHVENIQDEIKLSPSKRERKASSEPINNPRKLENIPLAEPLVQAEVGQSGDKGIFPVYQYEYTLSICDSVFVNSPNGGGGRLEWILSLPDVPPK